jgi:hypothetical protein
MGVGAAFGNPSADLIGGNRPVLPAICSYDLVHNLFGRLI